MLYKFRCLSQPKIWHWSHLFKWHKVHILSYRKGKNRNGAQWYQRKVLFCQHLKIATSGRDKKAKILNDKFQQNKIRRVTPKKSAARTKGEIIYSVQHQPKTLNERITRKSNTPKRYEQKPKRNINGGISKYAKWDVADEQNNTDDQRWIQKI